MRLPNVEDLRPSYQLMNLVSELCEFKGSFRERCSLSLSSDIQQLWRRKSLLESIGASTRIEGVKLTDMQIAILLKGVKSFSMRTRDEQEVGGYAELLEHVFQAHQGLFLSEKLIKKSHENLLKYSLKDQLHRGHYKKFANWIESPEGPGKPAVMQTATPQETPQKMRELIDWTNSQLANGPFHPLMTISLFALVFLKIQPFQDGNGRLSRALINLLLMQQGFTFSAYSSLEKVLEEKKSEYYLALFKGQSQLEANSARNKTGLLEWTEFFLSCLTQVKEDLKSKLEQESLDLEQPRLSQQLLALIRNRGVTSVAEAVQALGANRNTVKLHLRTLAQSGALIAEGVGRGTRYRVKFG